MGQVASRAFGSPGNALGMAPYIDLMNHSSSGPCPTWDPLRLIRRRCRGRFVSDDGEVLFYVPSVRDGLPRALERGDEVFINYIGSNADPVKVFLSFGFLPEEQRDALRKKFLGPVLATPVPE
eukprot:CAMPEP_0177606958 /NCGR_PEP_ID=MMETSP0419_2-20121207/17619_1 /TAXON_ID=582737 /ORGANISM="Tetraselmis sp., Strain GSL018" /LENGTH=122 /DNA_ID=CAMNT_0019101423 /DNA_START=1766 /DNA_END=2134 /DNA_ORIENTATION=+